MSNTAYLLTQAKNWYKKDIIESHLERTRKLRNAKEFNINPFITPFLSAFLTGSITAEGCARALVYARVLGVSISTSFGTNLQNFISSVLGNVEGSVVSGTDIKFIDQIDKKTKYAQLKLGPNNINKDDVKTIHDHFKNIKNLAKTNNASSTYDALIIGVLYGEFSELSSHYKKLESEYGYPIYIGQDLWYRLTGDPMFYSKLTQAFTSVVNEVNGSSLIEEIIADLAQSEEIRNIISQIKT